ncbi:MAG: serine--tRNA ligase [Candidatus Berkelbacteria bacterium]|nr:serine--tRNA ligase [Candidatus Berkelbacteria bacterium]
MLNIDFIKENKEKVSKAIKDKGIKLNLDELLKVDEERRSQISKIDELRAKQNEFNKKINSVSDKEKPEAIKGMKSISDEIKKFEPALKKTESKWQELMYLVPNIPSDDTPIGPDDKSNKVVEEWGEKPKFDFKFKDHLTLGKELDLFDLERGVKVSGFRGYYLKNEAAVLQVALLFYAFQKMIKQGFTPMITPTILKSFALYGSGHFPFGKDDIYELSNTGKDEKGKQIGENLYLAGTSEPALLGYLSGETIKFEDLPVKLCGFSQCYRNEVGSYGKDTKGLYRIHEFMKVEQAVICEADEKISEEWLQKMRGFSQEILKELKLPHRVLAICTGDMGAGKRKMYDIETYMPSRDGYGETHSDSDLTDWQMRRLNIKYTDKDGKKKFAYALNNTVIASPRILIAVLENFQNKDGSIDIPEVLQPLCGFKKIEKK